MSPLGSSLRRKGKNILSKWNKGWLYVSEMPAVGEPEQRGAINLLLVDFLLGVSGWLQDELNAGFHRSFCLVKQIPACVTRPSFIHRFCTITQQLLSIQNKETCWQMLPATLLSPPFHLILWPRFQNAVHFCILISICCYPISLLINLRTPKEQTSC